MTVTHNEVKSSKRVNEMEIGRKKAQTKPKLEQVDQVGQDNYNEHKNWGKKVEDTKNAQKETVMKIKVHDKLLYSDIRNEKLTVLIPQIRIRIAEEFGKRVVKVL